MFTITFGNITLSVGKPDKQVKKHKKSKEIDTSLFITKKCLNCGKEFISYISINKIYCCRECYYDAKTGISRGTRKTKDIVEKMFKICPLCNKEFIARRPNMIYCSKTCSNKYTYFNRYKRVPKQHKDDRGSVHIHAKPVERRSKSINGYLFDAEHNNMMSM